MTPDIAFWHGKRVCVTGGTGFLGFKIVRQLVTLGAHVRSLSLEPRAAHPIFSLESVERFFGDVRHANLVQKACQRCDVIFHTAGLIAVWGRALPQMHDIHVTGTRNVLDAAPRGARVVHTSSAVTIGASKGRSLTEDAPWNLPWLRVDYVQAKRAAEELALASAGQQRDVVVVNPAFLVGPEDSGSSVMGQFCLRFWKGRILFVPATGLNLVDVRDVAVGHLLAAERGHSGRRYILGGENVSFLALAQILASVAGMRPCRLGRMPIWIEWVVAAAAELRAIIRDREPYPSFQHVRMNRFTWFYDWSRAREELGFQPRLLAESLRETHHWYVARHSIGELRGIARLWMRPDAERS